MGTHPNPSGSPLLVQHIPPRAHHTVQAAAQSHALRDDAVYSAHAGCPEAAVDGKEHLVGSEAKCDDGEGHTNALRTPPLKGACVEGRCIKDSEQPWGSRLAPRRKRAR